MEDWRQERDRALLALERAKRWQERAEAAGLLVQLGLEDASRHAELAALIPQLIEDRDERVRRSGVALAAAVLPPEEAERVLGQKLSDGSAEVRVECAGQLADLARPGSRGLLAAALEDPDFHVRFEAARGMAALQHPAGLEVLVEGLDRDALRFRALGALAELGDARALPAIQRIHKRWILPGFERTQAAGAMARLGDPEGARWLMERSRKKGGNDRGLAIELLGELNAADARARLLEVLADTKDPCRGAAARGLGRLEDSSVVPQLAAVLAEPGIPGDLRLDAAEGLCLIGGAQARALVERALETEQDKIIREELRTMLEEYA